MWSHVLLVCVSIWLIEIDIYTECKKCKVVGLFSIALRLIVNDILVRN